MLRGLVKARDCEVGWNKVMKAWGSGDEKVVAKNFELLFNAGRGEDQARVGVAHHPMRGVGKVFSAEGAFTRNEGGGA